MSAYNVGDLGSIPGSGRSPGEGNDNPLQYSCLENPMDQGAWWATVQGVTKSGPLLSHFHFSLSQVLKITLWIPLGKGVILSTTAGVQPQLIQGIRRRDGVGEDQETTA